MTKFVNVKITIRYTEDGRPCEYHTRLLDQAVVLMEQLAKDKVNYTLMYEVEHD